MMFTGRGDWVAFLLCFMLAVALIASVASLAWLIGQTVAIGPSAPRATAASSPTASKLSTVRPSEIEMGMPVSISTVNSKKIIKAFMTHLLGDDRVRFFADV